MAREQMQTSPTQSPAAAVVRRRRQLCFIVLAAAALLLLVAILDNLGVFHGWRPLQRLGLVAHAGDDWADFDRKTVLVQRVLDGDTVEVRTPGGSVTAVRLYGVRSPVGPASLARLIEGKPVLLRLQGPQTRDREGRLLAYLYLSDSQQANLELIASGQARADRSCPHPFLGQFEQAEAAARKKGLGLWERVRRPASRPTGAVRRLP